MNTNQLENMDDLCKILKTIGNKNRLRILMLLSEGESSVGEIDRQLRIKQPNLSHELKKLRDLGLVSTRRDSKVIHYAIANDQIADLINGLIYMASLNLGNDEGKIKIRTGFTEGTAQRPALAENGSANSVFRLQRDGEYGEFPIIRH